MHDDDVFRIILIAGFLIFMPIGVWRRIQKIHAADGPIFTRGGHGAKSGKVTF